MVERSLLWTDATGDGGPYNQTLLAEWLEYLFTGDQAAAEGVLKNALNGLEVTGVATPVAVNTGSGMAKGHFYINTASVNVAVATPAGSTRVDLIVLQASWATQTVRIARHAGIEGAGAPALTQVDGTTWEVPLAQASITTGGVITVTDTRVWCHYASGISTEMLDDLAVTTAKINALAVTTAKINDLGVTNAKLATDSVTFVKIQNATVDTAKITDLAIETAKIDDEAVTPAKILNRTRTFFVPIQSGYNDTDATQIVTHGLGVIFPTAKTCTCSAFSQVPADYVSGLAARVIFFVSSTGVVRVHRRFYRGAFGATFDASDSGDVVTDYDILVAWAYDSELTSSGGAPVARDFVNVTFNREGAHANDVNAGSMYVVGMEMSYTADS